MYLIIFLYIGDWYNCSLKFYVGHFFLPQDIIMNFIAIFLWIAVGGIALHYWIGYQNEHHYQQVTSERGIGITLGILCVLSGALYLIDTVLSFIHFVKDLEYR